jgi:hypothetical protein
LRMYRDKAMSGLCDFFIYRFELKEEYVLIS